MFKKLHAKIDEVLAILRLLKELLGDVKATMAVVGKDVTDGKATLAQVQALTGHTATVVAMTAQAAVPSAVPVGPPPPPAAPLKADLAKDVAAVDPMKGVKLP